MNKRMMNYDDSGIGYAKQLIQENHYIRSGFLLVGLVLAGGAVYFGYTRYKNSREASAQQDLAQGLREYMQAPERASLWPEVKDLLHAGYERNKNTDLAPYFEFFEADALLAQDKKEEAGELLERALKNISQSSPLYFVYATKTALVNIDLDKESGIAQLQNLAYDAKNMQRDLALYYLGQYYWSRDDIEAAQREWQECVSLKKPGLKNESGWIVLAEKKLEQIV